MTTEIDAEGLADLQMARSLIQEAKSFEGERGGPITDHLDAAEGWLDRIESHLTRTSEAEPVAWLHLPTGNVFGNDADYRKRLDAWKRQFGEHVIHDFEPLGRITLPTPASDDQVEAVLSELRFLLDRLNDFENVLYDDHEAVRDWSGNVAPAVSRTSKALAAMGSTKPAPRLDATVRSGEEG